MGETIAKVILLGDPAVGKTSLVRRFVDGTFDEKYLTTIGTTVSKKLVKVNSTNMKLIIWDIFGQMTSQNFHWLYFKGAKAFLLVCDLTREDTIKNLSRWIDSFYKVVGDAPGIIITNKADLVPSKNNQLVLDMTKKFTLPYVITSAKTGENVEKAFEKVGELILERRENNNVTS